MPGQTPSQTVGPFFRDALIRGGENVLVSEQTAGQRILIKGRVLDGEGQPVPDALVEIWQADAHGFFNHEADPNQAQADPHFYGFGRADTVDNGRFTFNTVKPGTVPGQAAPFVNVRIFARGMLIHAVTRLYFADESGNEQDAVLHSLDEARRHTLIARQVETADLPTYRFDIRLQGENETVFFNP
jgi:protocatechuate 3,4-dioxygenase alpha subunit